MSFDQGHSLLVGVGGDLRCTATDAEALAALLRNPEICAYPHAQVTLLKERAACRNNILVELDRLATVDKKSTVVIYFSGHGYQVKSEKEDEYYLMPFGYDVHNLATTAINGKEFTYAIDRIPASKVLLLLDCCHAGGIDIAGVKSAGNTGFDVELKSVEMPPEIKVRLGQGHGRVVIASSRADEKSLTGKPYSVFTTALLEALRGKGAAKHDGFVRVLDLALHTREVVPYLTKTRQHPVADIKGQTDNFAVSYYAGGAHQPKAIPETLIWTPDDQRIVLPPAAPERSKTDYISFTNFRSFSESLLVALESELRNTGVGDLLIPEYHSIDSADDGWYFYFEAANSPLNHHLEEDAGYYFALRIVPQERPVAVRKAMARMYCIIDTSWLITTKRRPKIEVRKQLLQHLNKGVPKQGPYPATLDVGGIWLEIGAQRISSFNSWTADMIATIFANKIPVVEHGVMNFLGGRRKKRVVETIERDQLKSILDRFKQAGLI